MLSEKQRYALHVMGIDVWRCRDRLSAAEAAHSSAIEQAWEVAPAGLGNWLSRQHFVAVNESLDESQAEIVMCTDYSIQESASGGFAAEAGNLLDAMLKAIQLNRAALTIVQRAARGQGDPLSHYLGARHKAVLFFCALPTSYAEADFAAAGEAGQVCCGLPLLSTFHPSYLLSNAGAKRSAWEALKQLRALIHNNERSAD